LLHAEQRTFAEAIGVNFAATPPTVTFKVTWAAGSRVAPSTATTVHYNHKIWLLVDYIEIGADGNPSGSWTRATIAGAATVTGIGTASTVTGNNRGFWLDGTAAGAAAYSATVTVPLGVTNSTGTGKFNWCAYPFDRAPHATEENGYYELHGTPPFTVNNTPLTPAAATTYTGCITALNDYTDYPVTVLPGTPTVSNYTATASSVCSGSPVTLTATATGAASYSFDGGTVWTTAPSTVVTPTTAFNTSTAYTYTLAVRNGAGCSVTASSQVVTAHYVPAASFTNAPSTACAGSNIVLTAGGAGTGGSYSFSAVCSACSHTNIYKTGGNEPAGQGCIFNDMDGSYTTANTYTVALPDEGTVTVTLTVKTPAGCTATATHTIAVTLPAFDAGAIVGGSTTTAPGTDPGITIAGQTPATGADGNVTYQWRRLRTRFGSNLPTPAQWLHCCPSPRQWCA
jgi:hypothetical protein